MLPADPVLPADSGSPAARVALITGTNRGTGRGIARALCDSGYRIISLNRTVTGEEWLGEIRCDLLDPGALDQALARVAEAAPRLDLCVLNAAVRRLAPVAAMPVADWRASVEINLTAPFLITRATLPAVRRARGLYVFVGSHAATRFFEGGSAYSATKAALKALVEALLLEERAAGVRAVLISPGAIANRAADESTAKMSPLSVGRIIADVALRTPADVAVGEIELRPAVLSEPLVTGMSRLQSV